jgi:enolase-phosphatase E1
MFSGFFDTRMGPKTSPESYVHISKELKRLPGEILFISDQVKELGAAKQAGMQVLICIRPYNSLPPENGYSSVESFDEIVS